MISKRSVLLFLLAIAIGTFLLFLSFWEPTAGHQSICSQCRAETLSSLEIVDTRGATEVSVLTVRKKPSGQFELTSPINAPMNEGEFRFFWEALSTGSGLKLKKMGEGPLDPRVSPSHFKVRVNDQLSLVVGAELTADGQVFVYDAFSQQLWVADPVWQQLLPKNYIDWVSPYPFPETLRRFKELTLFVGNKKLHFTNRVHGWASIHDPKVHGDQVNRYLEGLEQAKMSVFILPEGANSAFEKELFLEGVSADQQTLRWYTVTGPVVPAGKVLFLSSSQSQKYGFLISEKEFSRMVWTREDFYLPEDRN